MTAENLLAFTHGGTITHAVIVISTRRSTTRYHPLEGSIDSCPQFLGPDAKETVIRVSNEFCDSCRTFWYDKGGVGPARRR